MNDLNETENLEKKLELVQSCKNLLANPILLDYLVECSEENPEGFIKAFAKMEAKLLQALSNEEDVHMNKSDSHSKKSVQPPPLPQQQNNPSITYSIPRKQIVRQKTGSCPNLNI